MPVVSLEQMIPGTAPVLCNDRQHPDLLFACVPAPLPVQGRCTALSAENNNAPFLQSALAMCDKLSGALHRPLPCWLCTRLGLTHTHMHTYTHPFYVPSSSKATQSVCF